MKVTMYMTMSLNGIIARENDQEDFLSDVNWKSFRILAEKAGCFVVGRRAYEVVKKLYKDYNFDSMNVKKIFVVSKNPEFHLGGRYEVVKSPSAAVRKAEKCGFRNMILTGGSKTNTAFMKAGLVDEIIVNVEPAVLGKGIRLFAEGDFYKRLKLLKVKRISSGIIQLHYKVVK